MAAKNKTNIYSSIGLFIGNSFTYLSIFIVSILSSWFGMHQLPDAINRIDPDHAESALKLLIFCFILLLQFIQVFTRPKVPEIKPLLLLPNYRKLIFKRIVASNSFDFTFCIYFLASTGFICGGLWGMRLFIETILIFLIFLFITLSFRLNYFSLKMANRYIGKSSWKILYSLALLITLILPFLNFEIDYSILTLVVTFIFILSLLIFRKNALLLFRYAFDNLEIKTISTYSLRSRNNTISFYLKEFRMLSRSKRLRTVFLLSFVYFFIAFMLLVFSIRENKYNFYLYMGFCSLSTFSDYVERFWAWDHKNRGLILSFPSAAGKYFHQKIYFAFVLHISVIIISMAFFQDYPLIGALLSILSIIALVIIGGYKSFSNYDMNTDLYCSIYEAKRRKWNKWLPMVVIPVFLLNGYFLEHIAATGLLTLYIFLLATLDISFFASLRRKYKLLEY